MATDLLARVRSELEERMAQLRPLLSEYERLLAAADTLATIDTEAALSDGSSTEHPPTAPTAPTKPAAPTTPRPTRARGPRGSAAGTIERAASPTVIDSIKLAAPVPAAAAHTYERTSTPRAPARSASLATLRDAPLRDAPPPSAIETLERPLSLTGGSEDEYEQAPERVPTSPGDVQQAILAALEHGSHTVSELVMVTALSTSEIRGNLTRLARRSKVTKVKRDGDGKSAYALRSASAHA